MPMRVLFFTWVSVSRAIKPFGEASRPPDWFSQKNCALQYAELLEKVDAPKRKRGERSDGTDTPGDLIVRKLTMDRIEELKKVVYEEQQRHKKLKRELEMVRSGQLDEKLEDLLRGVQDEIRAKEIADNEHQKWLQEREQKVAALKVATSKGLYPLPIKNKRSSNSYNLTRAEELRRSSYQSEMNEPDSNTESPLSEPLSIEVEESASSSVSHANVLIPDISLPQAMVKTSPRPPGLTITSSSTSPLLTSLLKSPSPATTPTTVTTLQTSPKAPILGSALQGSTPTKHVECVSPSLSRASQGVPLPFFNPSSALATAAARQLAVATAAPSLNTITSSGFSISSGDSATSASSNIMGGINANRAQSQQLSSLQSVQSVTSSAPTLSRLLEMPPSMPGKLPPLPVVQPQTPVLAETSLSHVAQAIVASTNSVRGRTPITSVTQSNTHSFIGNVKIDSATNWDSAILALQEVTASAKNESDLSQIEAQVASLVEGVCEVEQAFRDELDHEGTGLDVDMEAIVNEIMKEEIQVVTPDDSPEVQQDILSDIANLQSTDILEVEDGGTIEVHVVPQEHTVEEIETVKSPATVNELLNPRIKEEDEVVDEVKILEFPDEIIREEDIENMSEVPVLVESIKEEPVKINETETLASLDVKVEIEMVKEEVAAHSDYKESDIVVGEAEVAVMPNALDNETPYNLEEVVTEEIVISDKDIIEASEEEIDEKEPQEKPLKFPDGLSESEVASVDPDETPDGKTDQSDDGSEIVALTPVTASSSRETSEPREDECKLELKDPVLQQLDDESSNIEGGKQKAPSSISDSIPNSPASTPQSCDDQENVKEHKVWKKAMMLVWRSIANHKYANVFLHPVTNDVAPGYQSIVYRPMNLAAIKKNIELGVTRTTVEFQRDVLLMFQNAIMYNSSDHDVFNMAVEMQKEVMEVIQLMVQTSESKVLRGREGRDKKLEAVKLEPDFKDDEEIKRKRSSTSESSDSRLKKRRRQED